MKIPSPKEALAELQLPDLHLPELHLPDLHLPQLQLPQLPDPQQITRELATASSSLALAALTSTACATPSSSSEDLGPAPWSQTIEEACDSGDAMACVQEAEQRRLDNGGRLTPPPIVVDTAESGSPTGAADEGAERAQRRRAKIKGVIARSAGVLHYCYEERLDERPDLSGRVEVRFVIDDQGKVTGATAASDSTQDPQLVNCVLRRVRDLRFPPSVAQGEVLVDHALEFEAAELDILDIDPTRS